MNFDRNPFLYVLLRGEKPIAFFENAIDAQLCKEAIEKRIQMAPGRLKIIRKDGVPLSGFDF